MVTPWNSRSQDFNYPTGFHPGDSTLMPYSFDKILSNIKRIPIPNFRLTIH